MRTPERYIAAVHAGVSAEAGDERLEPVPRAEEACALALRTRAGSPVADAAAPVVDELAESGFVRRVGDRVVLTPRGRLLASDVTARLLVAGSGWHSVTSSANGERESDSRPAGPSGRT